MPIPSDAVATRGAAKELRDRIKDFADYRRSAAVAQRLFRLPTEALVSVLGSSTCGVIFSVILGVIDIATPTAAAALAFPFALLASACGPMLLYRRASSRNISTRDQLLLMLDDEIKRTGNSDGAPKQYREHLYTLRSKVLDDKVDADLVSGPRVPRDTLSSG